MTDLMWERLRRRDADICGDQGAGEPARRGRGAHSALAVLWQVPAAGQGAQHQDHQQDGDFLLQCQLQRPHAPHQGVVLIYPGLKSV